MNKSIVLGLFIFANLVACKSSQDSIEESSKPNLNLSKNLNSPLNSQATMVYNRYLIENPEGHYEFNIENAPKLKDHYSIEDGELCTEVKGKELPITANCSGVLVGADLLLTAGQCYLGQQKTCDDFKWIFDYSPTQKSFNSKQVYSCKKVIHYSVSVDLNETKDQWALIQLDRIVEKKHPLELAKSFDEQSGRVLGNLFGLSPKLTRVKEIIQNGDFKSGDFDQEFPVPGSTILNDKNEILGVVIRTEGGFVKDEQRGCYLPKKCDDEQCNQTIISSIEELPYTVKKKVLKIKAYNALESNDKHKLKELIYQGVNLKTKDHYGKTLALRALELGRIELFKVLFEHGVDLDATDNIGQGLFHYIVRGNVHEAFNFFSQWNVDINKKDSLGRTALYLAKQLNHLTMIEKLTERGATLGNPRVAKGFLDFCNDPYASEKTKLTVELLKNRVSKGNCNEAYISLSDLEHIYISHNQLSDLRPLMDFIKLERLEIRSESLEDISFLKELKNLKKVTIKANFFGDLAPLSSLSNLDSVELEGEADFSTLSDLKGLKSLKVKTNKMIDTAFLSSMLEIEVLHLEADIENLIIPKLNKLEEIKIQIGKEFDLSVLEGLTGLKKITAQYNELTDISALSSLVGLERLYLTQNKITDLSPLASLKKLKTLVVSRNPIKKGEEFCPTKNVSKALARFCRRNNR